MNTYRNLLILLFVLNIYFVFSIETTSYIKKSNVHSCILDTSLSYLQTSTHLDCIKQLDHDYKISTLVKKDIKKGDTPIKLNISIKQKNLHRLESMLMDVSRPDSPNYGKHLKQSEVKELFHDDQAALKVESWLRESCSNIYELTNNGNSIVIVLPISCAEEMLQTEFYYFKSERTKKVITRAFSYSLPTSMLDSIHLVMGVTNFPSTSSKGFKYTKHIESAVTESGITVSYGVTPAFLNQFYSIDFNYAINSIQGIFETDGEYFNFDYMTTFMNTLGITVPYKDYVIKAGNANYGSFCNTNGIDCTESMLDIEYMMSISQYAKTVFYEKDYSPNSIYSEAANYAITFDDWLISISNDNNNVQVYSISYGLNENQQDSTFVEYNNLFNTEAMKLGLQGVTLVVSSGDQGISGRGNGCLSSDLSINPSFPASSPYVTSVGATMGADISNPYGTEVVCSAPSSIITSGGGFSTVNAMPCYQKSLVTDYLNLNIYTNPPVYNSSGHLNYNTSNRGYPDVSLLGNEYNIIAASATDLEMVSGTSASAPVFAAMISIINSLRINNGLPVVGFINPALYSGYSIVNSPFQDITSGDNSCSDSNSACCIFGFSAAVGWDPVSGLGSVNFQLLREMFGITILPAVPYLPSSTPYPWPNSAYSFDIGVGISTLIFGIRYFFCSAAPKPDAYKLLNAPKPGAYAFNQPNYPANNMVPNQPNAPAHPNQPSVPANYYQPAVPVQKK